MKIRVAKLEDLDAITALLNANALTVSDIDCELLRDFAVGEDGDGLIVGSVGLERYDSYTLLRSLAVAQIARTMGLGSRLLDHAEGFARDSGITELWLLTTTAPEFFRRHGYFAEERRAAPASLLTTTQFTRLCPASAICMRKIISER